MRNLQLGAVNKGDEGSKAHGADIMLLPSSWHAGTGQYVHVTVTPTNSSAAADDRVDDELHATDDGPGLELNRRGTGPDRTAHRCSVPVSDSHWLVLSM